MLFLFATLQSYAVAAKRSRDETGATAVEYGLLVGLIAVVIIVAVTALGNNLTTLFNDIAGKVSPAKAG